VSPADRLTPADRTAIRQHKSHILDTLPENAINAINAKTPKSENDNFDDWIRRAIERALGLASGSLTLWDPVG